MKKLRSSIGAKLALTVLISVLGALLLMTAASSWREVVRYSEVKQQELDATAKIFASTIAEYVAAKDKNQTLRALRAIARLPQIEYVEVYDADGRRLASLGSGVLLDRKSGADGEPTILELLKGNPVRVSTPIVKSGQKAGTVNLVASTADLRERLVSELWTVALIGIAAALVSLAMALKLQGTILKPIRSLTKAMSEVREQQSFDKLVAKESDDETGVLVDTFNDMLSHIRQRDAQLASSTRKLSSSG